MSLVATRYQTVDDASYYSTMFGGAASYGFSSYAPTNTSFNSHFGAVVQREQSGYVPRVLNPFHKRETPYIGTVGAPNAARPTLRPENDRLDKLVQVGLVKMEATISHLRSLAEEADRVRSTMSDSETGGSGDLREQLTAANKEIFRLRTLLAQEGGAGDLDFVGFEEEGQEEEGEEEEEEEERAPLGSDVPTYEQPPQAYAAAAGGSITGSPSSSSGGKQFSFFGLMVADGIKNRHEGSKQEYGAVKVVRVWGPAAAAGIQRLDFITHIDGTQVMNLSDFNRVVSQIEPNQDVSVLLERNGSRMEFTVHTSNTDVEPGTITHHNVAEKQPVRRIQNASAPQIRGSGSNRIANAAPSRREEPDSQTLHL